MVQNENFIKLAYKVLHDITALFLVAYAAALIMETVLPGFVSNHISFARISAALLFLIILTISAGTKLEVSQSSKDTRDKRKKKIISFFAFSIFFLFMLSSMLSMPIFQNILLSILLTATFYLLYREIN